MSIANITKDDICKIIGNQDKKVGEFILEHFIFVDRNESKKNVIHISDKGMGGGISKKITNISLNWKKLIIDGSESIITIFGVSVYPILIPLAALVVWNKFYALMDIRLTELHAIMIFSLWKKYNDDDDNNFSTLKILQIVNDNLFTFNKPKIDVIQTNKILQDLLEIGCIKKVEENKFTLQEEVIIE